MTHLVWAPDGQIVATVGVNTKFLELRDKEGKHPQRLGFPFSTVKFWYARTGKLKQSLGTEKASVSDIAFSPDGKTVVMVVFKFPEKMYSRWVEKAGEPPPDHGKQEVRIVDAATGALKRTVPKEGAVQSLAFSPDGKTLAFGGNSDRVVGGSYVKLWDVQSEKTKGGTRFAAKTVMAVRDGGADNLTYSPDGKLLAAGDRHGAVRLFDAQTGEVKQVLEAHRGVVRGIAFLRDGQTLVSGSEDKTVKLWDVQTGRLRRTLRRHRGGRSRCRLLPGRKAAGDRWGCERGRQVHHGGTAVGYEDLGSEADPP